MTKNLKLETPFLCAILCLTRSDQKLTIHKKIQHDVMMHTQVMQDALDEATDSWGVKVGSDNEIKMVRFLKCHEANGLGNMARW